MRRTFAVLGFSALVSAAVAGGTLLLPNPTEASPTETTFLVPANDGYGVADCLISGAACGHVVAKTWCEAQGYARAVSFRQAESAETTGTVQTIALSSKERPIAITCAN
jgi:hypothetical protein